MFSKKCQKKNGGKEQLSPTSPQPTARYRCQKKGVEDEPASVKSKVTKTGGFHQNSV
jgi:hypothetical protein